MRNTSHYTVPGFVALLIVAVADISRAAPMSVSQTYQFLDHVTANTVGIQPGQRQQFGSTCVVLLGKPCSPQDQNNAIGTSVTGTQGGLNVSLGYVSSALGSNHWAYAREPSTLPDDAWTLVARNGTDTATATTPTLAGATLMGFAQGTAITQNGLTPGFSWSLPAGSVNAVTAQIRDIQDVRNGVSTIIYRRSLAADATSFSVIANDSAFLLGKSLQLGKLYALELQVQDTRNNTANGAFPNVLSQSRTLLNFTLGGTETAPQFLPIVDLTGPAPVYRFEGVPVIAGQTVLIDPDVAVGYDYQVSVGNPLFRSVTLPTGVGDGMFGLRSWDGTQWVDSGLALAGGVEHLFGGMGLDRFRITGIEPEAGVDPYVAGSFTTGVSFMGSGRFDGTMTALITTAVPEPASAVLAALGSVAVLALRRRRNQHYSSPS